MDLLGMAAGFVLGFLASWLFWRSRLMIQPELSVSSQIAVRQSKSHPGLPFYQVKIVNLSKRAIIDMTATLGIHEINEENRGPSRKLIHSLKLMPSRATFVGPKSRNYDPWSITNVHYYTSEPDDQVEKLLKGKRKLVFTVLATDATSGTTLVKRVLYTKSDLVSGHFREKRNMEILSSDEGKTQQAHPAYAPKARSADA